MNRNFLFIYIILLFSCGDETTNSISSPQLNFYSADQEFLDDISASNSKPLEYFLEFINNVIYDSSGFKTYKIKKIFFGSMGLDSLPASIGNLDSLIVLNINDNELEYITESVCDIYAQLDTFKIFNNSICTPTIPECIEQNSTITEFYSDQGCDILPDEGDRDFILDLINENWPDTTTEFIDALKISYTKWENFWEDGKLVSRIKEIRYDNKNITKIPNSIADLDSLQWLELQNNHITIIPPYIGSLDRLQSLFLQQNQIIKIPAQIGNLASLEVLKIYENRIDEVHHNIGNLNNLITLWISENELSILPDSMCNILNNSEIEIYLDNNYLCSNENNDCFTDLIDNSIQDCDE